jgi:hypothetical protein
MELTRLIDFSGVPTNCLPAVAADVKPLIEKALEYSLGEYMALDLLSYIHEGKMQLWVAADDHEIVGCVVTELKNFSRKKVCQIVVVAGERFDQWKYGYDLIEQWAFTLGAEEIRFYGRPGWEKVMNPQGFNKAYTVMTKELHGDAYTH